MGWIVEMPGMNPEQFPSKAAAEEWLERYYRTQPLYRRRRLSSVIQVQYHPDAEERRANAWDTILQDVEGDPELAYMNYLRQVAEEEGYQIEFLDGGVTGTEGDRGMQEQLGAGQKSGTLRYRLSPLATGPFSTSIRDAAGVLGASGPIAGFGGQIAEAVMSDEPGFHTLDKEVTLFWDASTIGAETSFVQEREEEEYESQDATEGLRDIDEELQLAKMEYDKWEAERELFTVSDIMAGMRRPDRKVAAQVYQDGRKYVDSTTAQNRLGGPGKLGSAIANLRDAGKNQIADRILESELSLTGFDPGAAAQVDNFQKPGDDLGGFEDPGFYFGGGGGGGWSAPEPVYRPPDRREVEDEVRGILSQLVGVAENSRLQRLTDKYMSAHKRAWDNEGLGLNPVYDVLEDVRKSADYKFIHELRPDTVDENDWIAERTYQAQRAGMSDMMAQQFSIDQAATGAAVGDIADAASVHRFANTGLSEGTLFDRIGQNASNLLRNVR